MKERWYWQAAHTPATHKLQLLLHFRDFVTFGFGSTPQNAGGYCLHSGDRNAHLPYPTSCCHRVTSSNCQTFLSFCILVSYHSFLLVVPRESPYLASRTGKHSLRLSPAVWGRQTQKRHNLWLIVVTVKRDKCSTIIAGKMKMTQWGNIKRARSI